MKKQIYKLLILLIPLIHIWQLSLNVYESHKQNEVSKIKIYTTKFENTSQIPLVRAIPTINPTLSPTSILKSTSTPTIKPKTTTKPTVKPPNLNIPLSKDLQKHIFKLCNEDTDLYILMIAIMDQESSFNPDSISADGRDFGLFQIRDINFSWLKKELNIDDCIDPYNNSKCAIHMIKKLIDKYEHYNLALMAYNMGEYGAKRKWEKGIYSSSYSRAVLPKYEAYKKQAKER